MEKFNKFDANNKVLLSVMKPEDKALLIELLMRCDADWFCYPSVQRLCQARGIKHEKNFKGAEAYLPGLVRSEKQGRKKVYYVDIEAIMRLADAEVVIKHTPRVAAVAPAQPADVPVTAEHAPGTAENVPCEEGAYSSLDTTEKSTRDTSRDSTEDGSVAKAPLPSSLTSSSNKEEVPSSPLLSLHTEGFGWESPRDAGSALEEQGHLVPAGVAPWDEEEEW